MGPKVSAKKPWFALYCWRTPGLLVSSHTCCLIPTLAYKDGQVGAAEWQSLQQHRVSNWEPASQH